MNQDDIDVLDSLPECCIPELLKLYAGILAELRRRRIVRTANGPVGDYAELLVAELVSGELAGTSEKSWDVLTPSGQRL